MRETPPVKDPYSRLAWASVLRQALDWIWVSAAVGILFNAFHPSGIELKVKPQKALSVPAPRSSPPETYKGWNLPDRRGTTASKPAVASPASEGPRLVYIGLLGAKKAFDEQSAAFIDSRKAEEYAAGHIPGALNFYADDFDHWAGQVLPRLDPAKSYILYCTGSECDLSKELAAKLDQQGFKSLKVFFGGWPEWTQAGYPTREGPNP